MGRNKPRVVELNTLFKAVSFKQLVAPLMMRYSSGQAVSKWAHLEVAVGAFKTEFHSFVSENVSVDDVLERPSAFLVDGSCLDGLRVWARVLSNLYVYTRGTPDASSSGATLDAVSHDAEDVYQRMLLTDGELARLVGVARASVSSYHQSVMPGWMGSDEVGYGHPSVAAAFGIWKSKFELYCVTEFERVYISESVRIHSSVALHVPPENGLALMMLTGVDVDKLFQLTPSGLSATRCMCSECQFFLKDLDDGALRVKGKRSHSRSVNDPPRMSAALLSHLRHSPVVPGLHCTVALVPDCFPQLEVVRGVPTVPSVGSSAEPSAEMDPAVLRVGPSCAPPSAELDPAVLRVYDGTFLRVGQTRRVRVLGLMRAIMDNVMVTRIIGVGESDQYGHVNSFRFTRGWYIPYLSKVVGEIRNVANLWPFEVFAANVRDACH